jgi:hypothetical protein
MEDQMSTKDNPRPLVALLSTAALWLALGQPTAVHAAPILYQFAGTVAVADASTGLTPGSQFAGTFTYDPDAYPGDYLAGTATYSRPFDPPYSGGPGMTLSVGGQKIMDSPFLNVTTTDNPPSSVSIMGVGPSVLDGRQFRTELELLDPIGLVYGLYGPTSTLSLANFSEGTLNVTWGQQVMFTGTVTSLTTTTVPEPASATLVCLATVGWLALSRRRQTRPA